MNKKNNLTLIFPKLKNVDLLKDMGLIPYLLQKNHNFSSTIACYKNEINYSYLEKELKEQKVDFIPKRIFATYWYLIKNYKKIDILMLVHIGSSTIYLTLLYKFLKPNGYVYMKGDMSTFTYPTEKKLFFFTHWKRKYLYKKFTSKVNLLSYENQSTYPFLKEIPSKKKLHIPNGFYEEIPKMLNIHNLPLEKKENIIFFPARHGMYAKNSELLLNALKEINLNGWKVIFAGDMTDKFKKKKNNFFLEYPDKKDSILFLGNIVDKKIFYEWYNRAKYTILPSRWEGFPLVALEALFFGNVLLLSNTIMSAYDLTKNGTIGFTFEGENISSLQELLNKVVQNNIDFVQEQKKSLQHYKENYRWDNLVAQLNTKISKDLEQ